MPILLFLTETILISLTGVMAPGPVTTVVVGKGSQSPHAGALVAIGHGIVEFPLMVAVFFGIGRLLDAPCVQGVIAVVGGLFLLAMGVGMIRGAGEVSVDAGNDGRSPVVAGIVMSIANPYFLAWWATIGAALILRSLEFGLLGFAAFAIAHWLCDFIWDYFLSALSFKGGQFFGLAFQKGVFVVCGALLLIFGTRLMLEGARGFLA